MNITRSTLKQASPHTRAARTLIIFLIVSFTFGAIACTTSEHVPATLEAPAPQTQPEPEQPPTPAPKTEQPKPTLSTADAVNLLAPAAASAAIANHAYQTCITEPSAAAVQYLMRAARFKEAADYAKRAPQTEIVRFLHAKARILAQQCTNEEPCFDEIDQLNAPNEDLKPIYDFWRVQAHIEDKNFTNGLKRLEAFLNSTHDLQKSRTLALAFCKAAEKANAFAHDADTRFKKADYQKLTSVLAKITKGANAFENASILYYEMKIAEALDQNKLARQKMMAIIQRYPATQMAIWPELAGDVQTLEKLLSPNERFARCERLISHFDYDDARKELKALIDNAKTPASIRDKAEWELARVSMTNSEEPKLSETIYRKWAQKPGKLKEEAVFGIARALSRQLKYEDAIEALKNYDKQYPRGKYHMRSLYLRGWYLFDLRKNDEARPLLKEYAERTGDTAVWGFYAQAFLRDHMWKEAIDAFEHLKGNGNPIVRGKALYWQAYAEHNRGNDDIAQKRLTELHKEYPLTWYDMLAYERENDWFGIDEEQKFAEIFKWREDPPQDTTFYAWGYGEPITHFPQSETWNRIETLADHDAIEEARKLYTANESALLNSIPANQRNQFRRYATHLVESYNAAWQDNSGSVRALSGVWPKRNNPKHKMGYPQPFAPLVESLAKQYGLPHYFIYGIMLQESRFRPWQVSSADAIGALQMIPKTARPIAKTLGLEFHPDTFFDPRVGFPYSAYYMKSHYERWGHNLTFTAGSYNGGPHRIGPWAIRDKGKTIDIIVDEFSFDESRHYARKVAEHTLRFAYLYARSQDEWLNIVHQIVPRVVPDIEPTDDWGL